MPIDTSESSPLKIFIGSGEASRVERKVLKYSIEISSPNCEIIVYNGTHDTLEYEDGRIERLHTPLEIKYQNVTEFSNFRWYIPQLCGFKGRAIYLDSDMICFEDLGIFNTIDLEGSQIMARSDAYSTKGKWGYDPEGAWALSMCIFDCARFPMTAKELFDGIEAGNYSYKEMHYMKPAFVNHYDLKLSDMPEGWNDLDIYRKETQLIHYTNLLTQPWKFPGHRYGGIWHQWLMRAMKDGAVTLKDVNQSINRGFVRPTLLDGNWVPPSRKPWRDAAYILPWYFSRLARLVGTMLTSDRKLP